MPSKKKQQSQKRGNQGTRSLRGQQGNLALDNNTYNVITILHEKSKGLEAFDKYIQDADEELRRALEEIRTQDEQSIRRLQQHLRQLLGEAEMEEMEEEEEAA